MKAIVFTEYGSTDALQLKEVDKPVPKADEVLVRVQATSINDWDWGFVRGKPFILRLLYGFPKPKIQILGVDVAGIVESVGKNAKKLKVGDEVYGDLSECGFGAFAEFVCAKEDALEIKPASMSFIDAAAIPHAMMLAVQGLIDQGKIRQGQKILINGAGGGVGTFGIQIAKLFGAEVTGVDSADKLEMLTSVGFDRVIDYQTVDFTKNGIKYDLILDAKTTRSLFSYARALNPKGTYVTIGGYLDRILQIFVLGSIFSLFSNKRIVVLGLKPNKDLGYANELFEAGKLKAVGVSSYDLSTLPNALKLFGEGKHKGKLVVQIQNAGRSTT